jgi:transmembrane sensor
MNAFEENKEDFEELALKFLSGDITEKEMSSFNDLLNLSTDNAHKFQELKEAWFASGEYSTSEGGLNTQESWEKVKVGLDRSLIIDDRKHFNYFSIGKLWKTAASWLLLISIGATGTWLLIHKKAPGPAVTCEISTPLGSRSRTILPDGTEVWLNAGTTMRYPASFSTKQRDVFLEGEAYFKVKSNKKCPFVVHTSDVKIKALGTIFNVKAYPTDKNIVTTLVEGMVQLENTEKNMKTFNYILKPKEKLTYYISENKVEKNADVESKSLAKENKLNEKQHDIVVNENINTNLLTSWKDPRWVIDGERIDNLAVLLERRYGVKINLLSNELALYKFSGTIENETLEQVLKYLKLATPIRFEVKKGYVDLMINEATKENYTSFLKKSLLKSN